MVSPEFRKISGKEHSVATPGSNIEQLISEHAAMMAEQMVKAVQWAGSEEDIRHEVNKLIDEFIKKAGLTVRGRHEYGLAGKFGDSKYGAVVIEYKHPKGSERITERKSSPGVKKVVSQIKDRFRDLHAQENVGMERILGVGCDGDAFVFVRQRGAKTDVEDPQPVTPHTVQRLLRAIVSLGARGLSFTPENLARYFGSEGKSAQEGVRLIHDLIHATDNQKAQTFFRQWQILFGEVCGYDIHGQSAKIGKLAEHYAVPDPNPAELLFAVHTYYAIFMKMLAAEIVSSFNPIGASTLKRMIQAPTDAKLRDELKYLEHGGIWKDLKIYNFLEGDLFSWYLDSWNDGCADAVRAMTQSFNEFDPTTLSVDPAESRDLLKHLYHELFPRSVRKSLGEYYTPDWLAELVLDELGYDGNPGKRLLDPACGSGTFLVMALNRVKTWYDEHRPECGFGEDELLRKVLRNIIGFDLNPLAVMAARTNYLMAIRDLLRHADKVELPVYLCDSIMTPVRYGERVIGFIDEETGKKGTMRIRGQALIDQSFLSDKGAVITDQTKPFKLKTAVHTFEIPAEIALEFGKIGAYAETIESCVRDNYSSAEFLQQCEDKGIPVAEKEFHVALYEQIRQLDANNQNGIWARIVKNAFAPLFIGKVDFVAGNPPWVNWENLPEDYRDDMKPLWVDYGLFTLTGHAARLGGGKKDLAIIFAYSAVDSYLAEKGRLGFVITQSVFKTQGAGDGFRRFQFDRGGHTYHLKPLRVHDLSAIQVFEGATNRTAVFTCEKRTGAFKYPVPYAVWRGASRLRQDLSLTEARGSTKQTGLRAIPVDPDKLTSPWLTAPKQALPGIQKVIGQSDYQAYAGCCTWLNAVYWIRLLEKLPSGELLVENLHDVGKIKVPHVQTVIEPDLVYPLLRGRDVQRWHAEPSALIILAQDPQTRTGIPESEMKRRWPKTYAYLKQFEGDPKKPVRGTLRGRSGYRQYFKPSDPFYSMYNVGPYTMAKWKVVWPWISKGMKVAVSGPLSSHVTIPEHNASFCSFQAKDEAYFLCALLSCAAVDLAIRSFYSGGGGGIASPEVVKSINLPPYDPKRAVHNTLASLSGACASACQDRAKESEISGLEAEIDEVAAKIWGITDAELKAIQKALNKQ